MLAHKNFTFPLNVYTHILYKDYGDVEYLHYGLFEEDNNDQDVQKAQIHATDLLLSHLPTPPTKILKVGIGLGTTLSKLLKAGYDIVGISPDQNQIQYAKNRYGEDLPIYCTQLEDFSCTEKFDLIIFQESAQYINTTTLFQKAYDLLTAEGRILIIDELLLQEKSESEPELPSVKDYLLNSNNLGFEIIEQSDLSNKALPTNTYILNSVTHYHEDLMTELGLSSEQINNLISATQNHIRKYYSGRYGYGLFHFKKKPIQLQTFLTEWAYIDNKAELLDLFLSAFGHEMKPELWDWKYQDSDIIGAIVRDKGQAIAFYGGAPRAIHLFGTLVTAVQICDVMVHPKKRGRLMRKGPFFKAATHFLEYFVGQKQVFPLAFGFPSEKAYRLGAHLGIYEKAGELIQVSWPPLQAPPSLKVKLRQLRHYQSETIDQLWLQMAEDLKKQVVCVRDARYIERRYLQHPTHSYQLYQLSSRLTGIPMGIMVLRITNDTIELVDIIAPLRAIKALIHCLRRFAWRLGASKVYTWITEQNTSLFATDESEISPTGVIIPQNKWTPSISADKLLDRWWLMSGDTDFH